MSNLMSNHLDVTNYDLVVAGTGLVESIVAAAAARVGKTVLHLDEKPSYGNRIATLDYKQMQSAFPGSSEDNLPLTPSELRQLYFDVTPVLTFARGPLVDTLMTSGVGRYIEFRLAEKSLTYSGTGFQSVPCSRSDIFTNKDIALLEKRYLMKFFNACMGNEVSAVPLEDYADKSFALFLSKCNLSNKIADILLYAISFARSDQRNDTATAAATAAAHAATAATAGAAGAAAAAAAAADTAGAGAAAAADTDTADDAFATAAGSHYVGEAAHNAADGGVLLAPVGVAAVKAYLACLNRFGSAASLYSLYGTSEIPQAFCRLCAVYGGVYMLRCGVTGYRQNPTPPASTAAPVAVAVAQAPVTTNESSPKQTNVTAAVATPAPPRAIALDTTEGQTIQCDRLLLGPEYAGDLVRADTNRAEFRAVVLLDRSLFGTQTVPLSLSVLPPHTVGNSAPVYIMQLDESSGCVPSGKFLLHVVCESHCDVDSVAVAQSLLAPFVARVASEAGATVIYERYFVQIPRVPIESASAVAGVFAAADTRSLDGLDTAIVQAKALFGRMFPGEVFLPPAPAEEQPDYPESRDLTSEFVSAPSLAGLSSESTEQSPATDTTPTDTVVAPDTTQADTVAAPVAAQHTQPTQAVAVSVPIATGQAASETQIEAAVKPTAEDL